MTRKKQQKRTRIIATSIDLSKEQANPETGKVHLNLSFDRINNTHIATVNGQVLNNTSLVNAYFGENKIRVLSEVPVEQNDHTLDFAMKLQSYDRLFAIDTNSEVIAGALRNIGFSIELVKDSLLNEYQYRFTPVLKLFSAPTNCPKPENSNWQRLIEFITSESTYNNTNKIGIIVDSDLGNLQLYNEFKKPYFDNYFLPKNFNFIYASDKSADNVLNQAISMCHTVGKRLFPIIREDLIKFTQTK